MLSEIKRNSLALLCALRTDDISMICFKTYIVNTMQKLITIRLYRQNIALQKMLHDHTCDWLGAQVTGK